MPRHVDKEQRLQDIADASIRLLSRGGPAALTLKALADELGGSITLVTHFYPNRPALLKGFWERFIERVMQDMDEIDTSSEDPQERLRAVVEWLLPLSEDSITLERMRIMMISQLESEPLFQPWVAEMEPLVRQILESHVTDLVPAKDVDITVDALRTFTNGVSISTVEHPEIWSPERQMRLLDFMLERLGLKDNQVSAAG